MSKISLRLQKLLPLLGVALFVCALFVLHRELKSIQLSQVIDYLHSIPRTMLAFALATTIVNYFGLTFYDALALRYLESQLPYRCAALTAGIGYPFCHSMGFAVLSAGSVRYRMYSAWGLSVIDIAKIIAFTSLTFWLGFTSLAGLCFVFVPIALPASIHLPAFAIKGLGALLLCLPFSYLALCVFRRNSIHWRTWRLRITPPRIAFAQVFVASMNWGLTGCVVFLLLPHAQGLTFLVFMGLFLLSLVLGVISMVPGGLGVFESAMVFLLSQYLPVSTILGSLLAFRVVYYLLPFGLAALALGIYELNGRRVRESVVRQR